ncbi:MAG TPA: hypothetical protein VFV41_02060 [Streptosporangiaceae bacterium]|nr:hypothetical protein [Streptosporangiaceae bacterium]
MSHGTARRVAAAAWSPVWAAPAREADAGAAAGHELTLMTGTAPAALLVVAAATGIVPGPAAIGGGFRIR